MSSFSLFAASLLAYAVCFSWRTPECYGPHLPKIKGKANNQPGAETGRAAIRGIIEPRCPVVRWFPVNAQGPE